MKQVLALFACFLVLLAGCNQNTKSKNSECYYDTVDTYAEIIKMKPHPEGNSRIAVMMDFKASSLALEDQELGALKDVFIDDAYLKKHNLRKGYKYEVTVSELVKGDCETKMTIAFSHKF